jgi:gluconate 2-dehydrogenase gamma chain
LKFFTEDEARLMDAIAGRILPGTPDDPGAREADVFFYIDQKLAYDQNDGFVEPTYFKPPFAEPYEGDTPPAPKPGAEKTIPVKKSEIDRYGFQSKATPQETYRKGLASVDKYAMLKFQKKFVDLTEAQQDQILTDMDEGKAKGFTSPSDRSFFKTLREDVIEGMFSDPAYGGNRDKVGWKLIGYPGAQRAYTPVDLNTEGNVRPPQSIVELHQFHPGQNANPDVIVPPSGSNFEKSPHR